MQRLEGSILKVFHIVIPHLRRSYILDGSAVVALQTLCMGTISILPPTKTFQRWLWKCEFGRGAQFSNVRVLYTQYHGAHLQRLFLRRLLTSSSHIAVTGSYALRVFWECWEKLPCPWLPNDMDIFVTTKGQLDQVQELYKEIVLLPLGLRYEVGIWKEYREMTRTNTADDGEESEWRMEAEESERASASGQATSSRLSVPDVRNRSELVDRVREWCDIGMDPFTESEMSAWNADICQQLQQVWQHLPSEFSGAPLYKLRETVKITPCQGNHPLYVKPVCFLPLNVILIEMRPGDETSSLMHTLTNGFDILNCASFLQVTEDLSYDVVCTPEVACANRQRKLVLSPYSFQGGTGDVHRSMLRIKKYLERGFHW